MAKTVMPLPAAAKPLRETMKRAGLDLVAIDADTLGVVPQTGGAAIYVGTLGDVATWFEKRGATTGRAP